jgi:aminoglycoside N3'-acetyltransferase
LFGLAILRSFRIGAGAALFLGSDFDAVTTVNTAEKISSFFCMCGK